MIRYAYPCPHCAQINSLTATQAGQELLCSGCQKTFEVPQLQVLRQYGVSNDSTVSEKKPANWAARDLLFALGLICLILGVSTGYGLYRYSHSLIFELANKDKEIEEQVDALSAGGVLWDWYHIEKNPDLPEWHEHPIIGNQKQGQILMKIAYGLWGLGGIGFLLLATSLMMRRGES